MSRNNNFPLEKKQTSKIYMSIYLLRCWPACLSFAADGKWRTCRGLHGTNDVTLRLGDYRYFVIRQKPRNTWNEEGLCGSGQKPAQALFLLFLCLAAVAFYFSFRSVARSPAYLLIFSRICR